MSQEAPEVTAARVEAGRARAQLIDSAHDLQARLKPKTLARDAWEGAKVKGADWAEDAVDVVRKRPLAATGVIAAVALYLAREPLMDLASRLMNGSGEPEDSDNALDTESVE
jgi:hypothetical protein